MATSSPQPALNHKITNQPNVTYATNVSEGDYEELPGDVIAKNIWIYGSAIIIICGTIGNILSILVMMQKSLRRHTTSLYLIVLAVIDIMVLYTGLLRNWIREVSGIDIREISVPSCKIHIFLVYFLFQFEAWILVCVAVERLGAIFIPLRAKMVFTKKFAAIQLGITGIVLVALNAHFFWTNTLVHVGCTTSHPAYVHFKDTIWPWVDFALASLVPFILMLSINIAIIARLVYLHNMRKQNLRRSEEAKMTTMTGILITVSFAFFVTTAPIAIYLATETRWEAEAETSDDEANLNIVWAGVNMAAYTNYAMNFILYCVSGPRFRCELLRMLHVERWFKKVNPTEATIDVTTHDVHV